jgi:hypothetical protein
VQPVTTPSLAFVGRGDLRNIVHCTRNVRREGAPNHTRGACAPHFTRKLGKLHPDLVQIGLEPEETEEVEISFLFSQISLLTLFASVETPCFAIAH